jgi:transcriptional regulator with XRE-family HTH domain
MSLSERLKETRKKLGLSQVELARLVDVSQPTIANWERGGHTPRPDALQRIASALQSDPIWLLSGEMPAWKNPAHMHLAKPIQHIPVYGWPLDATDPTLSQPKRYITVADDVTDIFGLHAHVDTGFPHGSILIFSSSARSCPGRFLCQTDNGYELRDYTLPVDDIFARLVYSVVPH